MTGACPPSRIPFMCLHIRISSRLSFPLQTWDVASTTCTQILPAFRRDPTSGSDWQEMGTGLWRVQGFWAHSLLVGSTFPSQLVKKIFLCTMSLIQSLFQSMKTPVEVRAGSRGPAARPALKWFSLYAGLTVRLYGCQHPSYKNCSHTPPSVDFNRVVDQDPKQLLTMVCLP